MFRKLVAAPILAAVAAGLTLLTAGAASAAPTATVSCHDGSDHGSWDNQDWASGYRSDDDCYDGDHGRRDSDTYYRDGDTPYRDGDGYYRDGDRDHHGRYYRDGDRYRGTSKVGDTSDAVQDFGNVLRDWTTVTSQDNPTNGDYDRLADDVTSFVRHSAHAINSGDPTRPRILT